jgi:hypothetical protein
LANLPAWVPPAFLVKSSPHGCANPVDRGDYTTYTLRNSYVDTLQHIISDCSRYTPLTLSWLTLAQNREQWKTLGTEWLKRRQALTIYHHGHHPLLGAGTLPRP